MEKICPNCARRCADTAGFCPICGTSLQNVMPVNNQQQIYYNTMGAVMPERIPEKASTGKNVLYFIPLVLMVIDILAMWLFDWASVSFYGEKTSFSMVTFYNNMPGETAMVLTVFMLPLIIDWILILIGSILLTFKKTAGKVLVIVGNSLLLPSSAFFALVVLAEVDVGPVDANLGFAPIFLFISTIAGIVIASVAKTGKALQKNNYLPFPLAYAGQTVFPANMTQQNYPPQYQNQNYYSNGQY